MHDDFENNNNNNYINPSNREDKNCKIHQEINDNISTRATAQTNAAYTNTVSKVAIKLIDYLLR